MMSYLKEFTNGQQSSMRLGWIIAVLLSAWLLFVVSVYILLMVILHDGVNDWYGLAAFVLGILAGLTGMGFAKAQQKKFETPNAGTNI